MNIRDTIHILRSIPKTLYFNFQYFKWKDAIQLPVFISHRVVLRETKGKITISNEKKMAMIRIGFGDVGHFDRRRSRSIWQVSGEINFRGKANIGHGSKISCRGKLTVGENFNITAESTLLCAKEITFGNNCLLSWDVLVMDTDFHPVFDKNKSRVNPDKAVVVGNDVWIGCRSTILKGTIIDNNTVVAANTVIGKKIEGKNQVIGGNPPAVIKKEIYWSGNV
jgi:acetyltransferase-like isoleucine patch superfamily enzyme